MNFKLKIVEGPNKGAEIAIPEGVAITLGKGDDCDVVLADATLPDAVLTLKAAPDGVTLDGEPLEPLAVAERGATAFAIGPADAPWGELKWLEMEASHAENPHEKNPRAETQSEGDENLRAAAPMREKKKRRSCLGCLVVFVFLLLALAALVLFFREEARPYIERARPYAEKVIARVSSLSRASSSSRASRDSSQSSLSSDPISTLQATIQRYGLAQTNRAGRAVLSGDFATRAERLAATAEAYAASPGIELDFSDGESLKTAAEDTFALVGERHLRVTAAANRVLVLSGTAVNLRRTLEALAVDLPKLRDVDCANVNISRGGAEIVENGREALDERRGDGGSTSRVSRLAPPKAVPTLPVCGILTTPYPCLVLKNGARVMEGAPFGDSVVLKIEADSVTLTNATGRFSWKP